MKSMIAIAAGIGLVTATPVSAGAGWEQFGTWEECMAAAEAYRADSFTNHTYSCSATASGGYELIWIKLRHTRDTQKRGGGKPVR